MSHPHQTRFDGVRVRYDGAKSYDQLLASLLADIGEKPVSLDGLATAGDWQSYEQQVEPIVEPNPELLSAAEELDAKLAALATKVTSGS